MEAGKFAEITPEMCGKCGAARRGLGYFGKTSRDMGVRSYLEDSLARRPDGRILNSARSV